MCNTTGCSSGCDARARTRTVKERRGGNQVRQKCRKPWSRRGKLAKAMYKWKGKRAERGKTRERRDRKRGRDVTVEKQTSRGRSTNMSEAQGISAC